MGMTATVVYKRLASLITEKYEKPYSKTMRVELLTAALGHHVLAWIQVLMTQPDPHWTCLLKGSVQSQD